ncbi:abscission/NoCut checkpoint regulator-like isoform X1 [Branchiostoma floridae x Branchiostoma belcheri]
MSGKCYRCATKFGLFKKEVGCPRCGFAFCSKCVGKSVVLPGQQAAKNVCYRCYDEVTSEKTKTAAGRYSPPANFKKRLEKHAAASDRSHTTAPLPGGPVQGRFPPGSKDREIAERLQRLKEDRKPAHIPTEQEMAARLAALKGTDKPPPSQQDITDRLAILQGRDPAASQASSSLLQPTQKRTDVERVDSLLNQIGEEVSLDNRTDGITQEGAENDLGKEGPSRDMSTSSGLPTNIPARSDSPTDTTPTQEEVQNLISQTRAELGTEQAGRQRTQELAHRLDRLKGLDNLTGDGACSKWDSDEDEAETTRRILQQALEEDKLDEKVKTSGYADLLGQKKGKVSNKAPGATKASRQKFVADESDSDEDLPWCCICNQDAVLTCHGCDEDLYCRRCYREGHDRMDMEDHTTSPYKPPAKGR